MFEITGEMKRLAREFLDASVAFAATIHTDLANPTVIDDNFCEKYQELLRVEWDLFMACDRNQEFEQKALESIRK